MMYDSVRAAWLLSATPGVLLVHRLVLHAQDLELPPEAVVPEAAAGERAPFSVPTPGTTPQNRWLQKCSMAAEHAAAGDFGSAMRLLERCVGSGALGLTVIVGGQNCNWAGVVSLDLVQLPRRDAGHW